MSRTERRADTAGPSALSGRAEFLDALAELVSALHESTKANDAAVRRAGEIQELAASGMSVSDIVRGEEPPLIVELTSDNVQRLYDVGGRLRRAEARALHDEGMTMDEIAQLFGVSRQRVSTLIKDAKS
jgi:DNA-directed RNA polymerase specialized sigma24 family protein